MTAQGRLTIPAELRRELRLEGETHFEIELRDGELVLRPAEIIPREDLWAYRPEHLRRVEQARAALRAGLGRKLTSADLGASADEDAETETAQ